jgi:hypothetical protein
MSGHDRYWNRWSWAALALAAGAICWTCPAPLQAMTSSCASCILGEADLILSASEVSPCSADYLEVMTSRASRRARKLRRAMRPCQTELHCVLPRQRRQVVKLVRAELANRQGAVCGGCTGDACPPSGTPSDVLRIRCLPNDHVEVLTPVVAAQPEGLRIEAEYPPPAGEVGVLSVARPNVSYWSGSSGLELPFVRPLPEGEARVWCIRGPYQFIPEDESKQGSFVVIDPDDVFLPYQLECGAAGERSLGFIFTTSFATLNEAARGILSGLQEGDIVELAGYVNGDPEWPWLNARVLRDGRVVAQLDVMAREGWAYWIHGGSVCDDSGILVRPELSQPWLP